MSNIVTCHAKLTFVGKSSMEVQVMVMVEDLSREESPTQALSALFTMVALDGDGKATKAPALEVLTEEERRLFEEGKQRYLERKRT